MEWVVEPNSGLGPIKLGMTQSEVAHVIGPAEDFFTDAEGTLTEDRGLMSPTCGYRDRRLIWIGTDRHCPGARLGDVSIYRDDPAAVIRTLYGLNGGAALEGLGSLLFIDIGITTTGFYAADERRFMQPDRGDEDVRTFAMFAPGYPCELLSEFRPLHLTM